VRQRLWPGLDRPAMWRRIAIERKTRHRPQLPDSAIPPALLAAAQARYSLGRRPRRVAQGARRHIPNRWEACNAGAVVKKSAKTHSCHETTRRKCEVRRWWRGPGAPRRSRGCCRGCPGSGSGRS
jgi:hypothetical protein